MLPRGCGLHKYRVTSPEVIKLQLPLSSNWMKKEKNETVKNNEQVSVFFCPGQRKRAFDMVITNGELEKIRVFLGLMTRILPRGTRESTSPSALKK